jgi:hypothetical protein
VHPEAPIIVRGETRPVIAEEGVSYDEDRRRTSRRIPVFELRPKGA